MIPIKNQNGCVYGFWLTRFLIKDELTKLNLLCNLLGQQKIFKFFLKNLGTSLFLLIVKGPLHLRFFFNDEEILHLRFFFRPDKGPHPPMLVSKNFKVETQWCVYRILIIFPKLNKNFSSRMRNSHFVTIFSWQSEKKFSWQKFCNEMRICHDT